MNTVAIAGGTCCHMVHMHVPFQGGYSMSYMVTQELTMMDEWWLYLYMLKKISKENMFETHGLYLFLYFSIRETVQKTIYYYTHSLAN